jgi:hypothetical protein
VQSTDDTISENGSPCSENGSPWFWTDLFDRSAGKMRVPVHQRMDAVRLFEPWRYGSGSLPNDGVFDDGPDSPSSPTSSTSTAWDVCVFAAARAHRLSLRRQTGSPTARRHELANTGASRYRELTSPGRFRRNRPAAIFRFERRRPETISCHCMYVTGSRGALLLSAFLPRLGPPTAGGPFFATEAVVTGRRQAAGYASGASAAT